MCESKGEKFVVPIERNHVMGLWVGQIVRKFVRHLEVGNPVSYQVNIIWPQNSWPDIIFTLGPFREFDSEKEAMDYLESKKKMFHRLYS